MIFTPTPIAGAYVIDVEMHEDERGWFARTFCADEFRNHGLNAALAQCSLSYNRRRGTLRGMHYQAAPHEEAKLIRCTRGIIYDVIIDLRAKSGSMGRWFGIELDANTHREIYVPEGCAHGFETLSDDVEVLYQMSEAHHPELARVIAWNDPSFGVRWPLPPVEMSKRDRHAPGYAG